MTLHELLAELSRQDIDVWAEGESLRVSAPSTGLDGDLRQRILEHKAGLLQLLRSKDSSPEMEVPKLLPLPQARHEPFPLTDIQQAYWIGRNGALELGQVSIHLYCELEGPDLDAPRLAAAWQRLIEQHEMLRAVVLPSGEQKILESTPPFRIEVVDLRSKPAEAVAEELARVRRTLSHQVLPADQWPLFEMRLSILAEDRRRLHVSLDLLMLDLASLRRLVEDWVRLYEDPSLELLSPGLSFRDYVLAEAELEQTPAYQRSRAYWLDRLATLPPAPQLPLEVQPSRLKQQRFVHRHWRLEATAWDRFQSQVRERGLTPSIVAATAFSAVLAKWSGSAWFTLNLTLFQRLPMHEEVEDLVGTFTSIIPLEVDFRTEESFLDRALRLQRQLQEDLEHRHFSGVQVLRELARRRGSGEQSRMPIVLTSALGHKSFGPGSWGLGALGKEVFAVTQTPQVWLDQQILEQEGALTVNWDSVEGLFPAGLIEAMLKAYGDLLQALASSGQAWSRTQRSPLPEDQRLSRELLNGLPSSSGDLLLHQPIVRQARDNPERIAVLTPGRSLTYGELWSRSQRLATTLTELGAGPHELVAIVMERGWEQVVAVLAVLFSGAAYLPINPADPERRRRYLLDHGKVAVALTQEDLASRLRWPETVRTLTVSASDVPVERVLHEPPPKGTPKDLAYVIYTSGSTGEPKGVMIDHRGAMNTLLDVQKRFELGPNDRVLSLSSLGFDLSVFDFLGVLGVGGAVVLPDEERAQDPSHWRELMDRHGVTLWNTVPALMQMMVEHVESSGPLAPPAHRLRPEAPEIPVDMELQQKVGEQEGGGQALRLVMLSGDWIPVSLPGRIAARWPGARVVSLGGATEASIWSVEYSIETVDPEWKSIPYGRPLSGQTCYVFDQRMEDRPDWVPGDLWIGGTGVALGYWRDEEKTALSFVPHPRTGERLYRTGDLARFHGDGNLEILGRSDNQVKINGFRIELGEIEAALESLPRVRQAVVLAVGESGQGRGLVAHVVEEKKADPAGMTLSDLFSTSEADDLLTVARDRLAFTLSRPALQEKQSLQLEIPLPAQDGLQQLRSPRRSDRRFSPQSLSGERVGRLLSCLGSTPSLDSPLPKLRYPSAGSCYAVEAFLFIEPGGVEGLASGFYVYLQTEHALVPVVGKVPGAGNMGLDEVMHAEINRPAYRSSKFSLFLIAHLGYMTGLYGERARDFCLLEAGYMGQLLQTQAAKEGIDIGLCPIGVVRSGEIQAHLGLQPEDELLHSFVGGASVDRTADLAADSPRGDILSHSLRRDLEARLPRHMVPARFLVLDQLPLGPNGKVDRKSLGATDSQGISNPIPLTAPSSELEVKVAEQVGEILGLETVGIHHNFFDLGADSLQVVRLHRVCCELFNADLSVVEVFAAPTVARLASRLDGSSAAAPEPVFEDRVVGQRKILAQRQRQARERQRP